MNSSQYASEVFHPFPEIVEALLGDKPYEVIDTLNQPFLPSNGITNKIDRQIMVPLHWTGRPISRHELAHVAWSPDRLPTVDFDPQILLAVEDARINLGLVFRKAPVVLSPGQKGEVGHLASKDLLHDQRGIFILRNLASIGTNAEAVTLAAGEDLDRALWHLALRLRERVRIRLERGRIEAGGPVAPFDVGLDVAREVARELEALGLFEKGGRRKFRAEAGCCLCVHPEGAGRGGRGPGIPVRGLRGRHGRGRGISSGRMKIVEAPLDLRCDGKVRSRARAYRPSCEGSVVRWFHRLPVDGAIFRRRVRRSGGSVLVDTSGSMSLGVKGVDRILAATAADTLVALYSGRERVGELRVVARGGKKAKPEHLKPYGGGNIVDIPALRWLENQAAPRIWVSDGEVTGIGDSGCHDLKREAERICRRSRILRVESVEEAAKELAGGRA